MRSHCGSAEIPARGLGSWTQQAIVASVVWVIAADYWGIHLPVGPAISAYSTCLLQTDPATCDLNLHQEWSKHSGYRLYCGALLTFAPLPIVG
jgi:hypothetical protein